MESSPRGNDLDAPVARLCLLLEEDRLSREDLTQWLVGVEASGDGSPAGLVEALGWETIVATAPDELLLGVIDALAAKVGLSHAE